MQKWAVGVDLGGTKIEVALVNADGQLLDRLRIPTDSSDGPDKIIEDIANIIHELTARHKDITPSTIGIGVAGQIEKNTGIIVFSPNLGWDNVNLSEQLTNILHLPVAVCNDVKAAAWGEWLHGAGVGCDNLVCIFVGTGIGGAIVCNGKMIEGCNNTAGEIGHTTIQLNGPLCHCGNRGCLEALAGGWAIERDAQQAVQNNKDDGKMMLEIAGGDIKAITGATVAIAVQKGDKMATQLLDNVVDALTAGITSVVNTVGPCRIILGGGVVEGIPQLAGRVETGVKKNALKAAIVSVSILQAKLHNDSGVIGAAAFALHQTLHQDKVVIYDH
jgi:glucokinase